MKFEPRYTHPPKGKQFSSNLMNIQNIDVLFNLEWDYSFDTNINLSEQELLAYSADYVSQYL